MSVSRSLVSMTTLLTPKKSTKRTSGACQNAYKWQAGKKSAASHQANEKTKPDLYASMGCMSWCTIMSSKAVLNIRETVHECMSLLGEMRVAFKNMLLSDIIYGNVCSICSRTTNGSERRYIRKLIRSCTPCNYWTITQ